MSTPIKVIQWATGTVGKLNIATCYQNSAFELVGCYVFSESKHGKDAGAIAGIGDIGVIATNNKEEILKLDCDVVIYTPLYNDEDDICALLASGKNVITSLGNTTVMDKAVEAKINAACQQGQSSMHGSGIHPGFAGDRLPLILSAMSRRIDKITVFEIVDMSLAAESWEMFQALGFAMSAEEAKQIPPPYMDVLAKTFYESINLVAQGLGIEIDEYNKSHDFAVALSDVEIPLNLEGTKIATIPKGHVAGQYFSYRGDIGGKTIIEFKTYWKLTKDVEPSWPYDDALAYNVIIDGEPPLRLDLTCGVEKGSPPYGLTGTAMNCLNSAPLVIAAAPGILTQLDLPMITAVNAVNLN